MGTNQGISAPSRSRQEGGLMRLRLWLAISDFLALLGLSGSRLYLWVIDRASNCVDWSECPKCEGDEPF